ncbi:AAA domain, putative AbiEii toxin, Type IV TA system [Bifidobacterium castoris]|uniref:AAA domain, putative AbiEii toxin, Type IV TA system n=2 Tax=Bifidobacterium castoris TaxID=2306972 RepID=A0A430FAE9_9BIFI|nr:AAA domain, putative AbiEii toxin, Type IV TA system [Bifidobacterium castoris]
MRLNGITVLVGENGTGKSTICRTLYATVKALRKNTDDIRRSRADSLFTLLLDYCLRTDRTDTITAPIGQAVEEMADELAALGPERTDRATVTRLLDRFLPPDDTEEDGKERTLLIDRLCKRLSFGDAEVLDRVRADVLRREHITNRDDTDGWMELENAGRGPDRLTVGGHVGSDADAATPPIGWGGDVTMLDGPRLLDGMVRSSIPHRNPWLRKPDDGHAADLRDKILAGGETDAVTQLAVDDAISRTLRSLRAHAGGELLIDRYGLKFKEDGVGRDLDMRDVSDGRKTFIMLLRLLGDNRIGEDDVLILDEPEIHLHPEWQLDLADMLVELRRAFNLTILVSTHSPYFLEALETYAARHGIADDMTCYMTRRKAQGGCVCEDITRNLEKAYGVLAAPFDRLDEERNAR